MKSNLEMTPTDVKKKRQASYDLTVACADAIIKLLNGEKPCMPDGLSIPTKIRERFSNHNLVLANWGSIALQCWAEKQLSGGQTTFLSNIHYDIDDIGTHFYCYLMGIKQEEEYQEPQNEPNNHHHNSLNDQADEINIENEIKTPSHYILQAAHPSTILDDWFGRFLSTPTGPFGRNLLYKLKQRYKDILSNSQEFIETKAGWFLKNPKNREHKPNDQLNCIASLVKDHFNKIEPFKYNSVKRQDPVIYDKDAIRIAEFVIGQTNAPVGSMRLAELTIPLLPEDLWLPVFPVPILVNQGTDTGSKKEDEEEIKANHIESSIVGTGEPDLRPESTASHKEGDEEEKHADSSFADAKEHEPDSVDASSPEKETSGEDFANNLLEQPENMDPVEIEDSPTDEVDVPNTQSDTNVLGKFSTEILNELGIIDSVILAARVCRRKGEEWEFKKIEEWLKAHLPEEYQIKLSTIQYRAQYNEDEDMYEECVDDKKIKDKFRNAFMQICSPEIKENPGGSGFISYFESIVRKILDEPSYLLSIAGNKIKKKTIRKLSSAKKKGEMK
jgi:hypothetical protein